MCLREVGSSVPGGPPQSYAEHTSTRWRRLSDGTDSQISVFLFQELTDLDHHLLVLGGALRLDRPVEARGNVEREALERFLWFRWRGLRGRLRIGPEAEVTHSSAAAGTLLSLGLAVVNETFLPAIRVLPTLS